MKVKGLDGRVYSWKLNGRIALGDETRPRSSYHLIARELLTKLYPMDILLEEVPLPGSGGLFCDFFIPAKSLIVEVQGEQHYKFIARFHQNVLGFIAAKNRDKTKRVWCDNNNIRLVELPYWEDKDVWRNRIQGRNSNHSEEG